MPTTEDKRENPNIRSPREAGRWGSQRPRGLVVRGQRQEHGETERRKGGNERRERNRDRDTRKK